VSIHEPSSFQATAHDELRPVPVATGRRFAIAAGHRAGAEAGAEIYDRTGNAADAAVAATLVLGVVEPHLFGLGGEVTGVVHADGRTRVLAGATVAPAAMTMEAFRRLGVDLVPWDGMLAAGPPAVLHALLLLLADHGSAPLSVVAAPAIRIAEDGFSVDPALARMIASLRDVMRDTWPSTAAVWMPDGRPPRPAEVIRQPALAETLRRFAASDEPVRELRTGFVAEAVAAFASEPHPSSAGTHRAFLTADDLATFSVGWEHPVTWTDRRGRTICKAGPWTQGPALLQQLMLMEAGGWDALPPLHADLLHATIETFKLAFADRERYYGDPRFVDVPLGVLLDPRSAAERARFIDAAAAGDPGPGAVRVSAPAVGDTTHLDVVDERMTIALTPSGGWFASPVIPSLGFPLGTRCQTFYLDRAHANALAPGKRPRTTLTPTLVLRDGAPLYAMGTPGGDAQDQIQSQMLHALAHGLAPEDVVDLPTVVTQHAPSSFYPHGAVPQGVTAESRLERATVGALAAKGHDVKDRGPWAHGRPQVIAIGPELRAAVSRRGGTAAALAR
jgi:gamma-glutamyltranspeptidase/glutathione hydrolase